MEQIESPKITPYIYGQFIFDKGAETIAYGKYCLFNTVYWDSGYPYMKEGGWTPYLTPYIKVSELLKLRTN